MVARARDNSDFHRELLFTTFNEGRSHSGPLQRARLSVWGFIFRMLVPFFVTFLLPTWHIITNATRIFPSGIWSRRIEV